jgi:hypothetical protein
MEKLAEECTVPVLITGNFLFLFPENQRFIPDA